MQNIVRLRRINPLQLGINLGVVLAVLSIFLTIVSAISGRVLYPVFTPLTVVFIPVRSFFFGWLGGMIAAVLYNAIAGWTGGIELIVEQSTIEQSAIEQPE
jgi:hypothetical protein